MDTYPQRLEAAVRRWAVALVAQVYATADVEVRDELGQRTPEDTASLTLDQLAVALRALAQAWSKRRCRGMALYEALMSLSVVADELRHNNVDRATRWAAVAALDLDIAQDGSHHDVALRLLLDRIPTPADQVLWVGVDQALRAGELLES